MKRQANSLPDTNIIIRHLLGDDPYMSARANDFFDDVKNGSVKAVILESIIAECIYVLTKIYRVPRAKAAESLIDILRYKGIANDDRQELIHALSIFAERSLDIVDCILCAKAMSGEGSLITFDADLNKLVRSI